MINGSALESYLHQQARERALNRVAEAKDEAERIVVQATQEAVAIRQTHDEHAARATAERRRRTLAQARLKARQTIVRRHEELLGLVWSEAAAKLRALVEPDKRLSLLKRLIADAAEQMGGGALEIQVNAQDHDLLTPEWLTEMRVALAGAYGVVSLEVAEEPIVAWGGAIVVRRDASQLVDNTLDARLAVAQRYFGGQVYHLLASAPRVEGKCSPSPAASK